MLAVQVMIVCGSVSHQAHNIPMNSALVPQALHGRGNQTIVSNHIQLENHDEIY